MYLKYLSLKGFKSFADAVRVQLSPGLTVVVGPNGSGKSNVVDALAWVLGAQSPKQLRSTKMEDVIFAGSANRPALGRAEVGLVFDNADGKLALPSAEVAIARRLFRSGESDYQLNGSSCRLIDLVELLSDAGVGKTQHIIISQGEVDDIVNSKVEERRFVLEEAAGILKFKRRRERAEKRMAEADEDLEKVSQIIKDVKRQIRPLERQAESARRRSSLLERHRALSLWIAQLELSDLKARFEAAERLQLQLLQRNTELEASVAQAESERAQLPAASSIPRDDLDQLLRRAENLRERLEGLALARRERLALLLERQRELVDRGQRPALDDRVLKARQRLSALAEAEEKLSLRHSALTEQEQLLEGIALEEVEPIEESLGAARLAQGEIHARLRESRAALELARRNSEESQTRRARIDEERHTRTQSIEKELLSRELLRGERDTLVVEVASLDAEHEEVVREIEIADDRVAEARAEEAAVTGELASLDRLVVESRQGAVKETLRGTPGFLGLLIDLVQIDDGYEFAVEAAFGGRGYAAQVRDLESAFVGFQRMHDAAHAGTINVLDAHEERGSLGRREGLDYLVDHVRPLSEYAELEQTITGLLANVVVVPFDEAHALIRRAPELIVVSLEGRKLSRSELSIPTHGSQVAKVRRERIEARKRVASDRVGSARASQAALIERRRVLEGEIANRRRRIDQADREIERQESNERHHREILARLDQELSDLDERMVSAEQIAQREMAFAQAEHQLAAQEATTRALEAELARVRSVHESHRQRVAALIELRHQIDLEASELQSALAAARLEFDQATSALGDHDRRVDEESQLRDDLDQRIARTHALGDELASELALVTSVASEFAHRLSRRDAEARAIVARIDALDQVLAGLKEEHESVRERIAAANVELATSRTRYEATLENHLRYLETTEEAIFGALPIEGVPVTQAHDALARLDRELAQVGEVNAFAETELVELNERLRFLEGQSADVRTSRHEIRQVIDEIDREMKEVFLATLDDVSASFAVLFDRLFPGGTGSLRLSDPEYPMNCGIELDIDLPTKKVRRLSLLSGGERSLVGLAFLFAVFRARPAPFVVLDEVEAALDDRNLSAFVRLVEEFRATTQLIIITHQKRTMEVADVLVGVSVGPDGSSRLVREDISSYLPLG
ncbi:MAG: chromosome segregation protein SMC [Acidimicrobiales bacterium]